MTLHYAPCIHDGVTEEVQAAHGLRQCITDLTATLLATACVIVRLVFCSIGERDAEAYVKRTLTSYPYLSMG